VVDTQRNCEEVAERHVAEAEKHAEHQKKLIEVLVRDKHYRALGHASKVLEVLEDRSSCRCSTVAAMRSTSTMAFTVPG
jgi:hypothetical protein